jgi:HEPN domain-containing protein
MSRGGPRTRPVSGTEARLFLGKAEEFLATAKEALSEYRNSAATGNAVHAGINAADAMLGALTGHRGAGQDHNQVVELIKAYRMLGPRPRTGYGGCCP